MVRNLPHKSVLLIVFSLRIVVLNEMIDQVGGMHNLLFAVARRNKVIKVTAVHITAHHLHPVHRLVADDSRRLRVDLATAFLDQLLQALFEQLRRHDAHF